MKGEDKKTFKILNIVLLVIESLFVVFAVSVTVLIFSVTDGVKKQRNQLNPTVVAIEDESLSLSSIEEGDLLINDKIANTNFPVDLGSVATYVIHYVGGVGLSTSRVVGYRFYDKGNEMYHNAYLKKGEMENYSDLSAKLSQANWQFYGYITRNDDVSIANGASLNDMAIYDSNGNVDNTKNTDIVFRDDLLAVNSKVVKGLGSVVTIFKNTTNFILLITVPLVVFIGLNVPMMLVDIDKKEKPTKKGENS